MKWQMVAALYEDENLQSERLGNSNWKNWFADKTQLIGSFQKMKMDQKFLSIDFDSGSELPGSLVAVRTLVQKIQVPNATT